MTRFLKLTNIIINTNKIIAIKISPTKYTFDIGSDRFDGIFLFGGGYIGSNPCSLDVCKDADPIDYEIVKEWIQQVK